MTAGFDITGVVLAGGQSRRMGRPKADLEIGGRSLVGRVVDTLAPLCSDLMIVSKHPLDFMDLGVKSVRDLIPGQGPLGGLATGLFFTRSQWALVAACDLPFLNPDLLADLVRRTATAPSGPRAIVARTEGGWQPLAAVYSTACLKYVDRLLAKGGKKVDDLRRHGVSWDSVPWEELDGYDGTLDSFLNVNTPEDLVLARAMAGRDTGDSAPEVDGGESQSGVGSKTLP